MKNIVTVVLVFAVLFVGKIFAGQLQMQGYFSAEFGKNLENDQFDWNMWDPNIYLETKLYGQPLPSSDLYLKFYNDKDWDYYKWSGYSLAVFSEGHIGFRQEKNNYGFSSKLFFRESGDYWLDSSLLGLIDTRSVSNKGDSQGGRFDFWHPKDGSMSYAFSDFSQGSGDDIHLLRYRQSFLKNKLRTGIFFQRKHYAIADTSDGSKDYNQVAAVDLKFQAGKYFFNGETAVSWTPAEDEIVSQNEEYYDNWKDIHKANIASKMELSGFKVGNSKIGNWFFSPGFYIYGNTYRNYMGDNKNNEIGYWFNSYYLVPQRAITLTVNFSGNQNLVADTLYVFTDGELQLIEISDPVTTLYTEAYIEFVNGFKGKISFTKKDEEWQGKEYKHYDFFSELTVENKLAKLLAQFKLKDMGETYEKQIAGIEISVNLTDNWRVFTRGMIANDRVGSRHSIFGEIQYRLSGNTEVFLQYGPSWYGPYGLVNDDGFASGGDMKEEIKLIVKGWF